MLVLLVVVIAVLVIVLLILVGYYVHLKMRKTENYQNKSMVVILYHANWCPHCRNMMPEWDTLTSEMHGKEHKGKKVSVTKINSDEEPDKVKAAGVQGFPEIHMNGSPLKVSSRSAQGIKEAVDRASS